MNPRKRYDPIGGDGIQTAMNKSKRYDRLGGDGLQTAMDRPTYVSHYSRIRGKAFCEGCQMQKPKPLLLVKSWRCNDCRSK